MDQNQQTIMERPCNRIARLQKLRKIKNQMLSGRPPNVDGKVGYQHHWRTDTLDKMQNMILQEEEENFMSAVIINRIAWPKRCR
jgi:uncharacterized protein (UPF0216 family)